MGGAPSCWNITKFLDLTGFFLIFYAAFNPNLIVSSLFRVVDNNISEIYYEGEKFLLNFTNNAFSSIRCYVKNLFFSQNSFHSSFSLFSQAYEEKSQIMFETLFQKRPQSGGCQHHFYTHCSVPYINKIFPIQNVCKSCKNEWNLCWFTSTL